MNRLKNQRALIAGLAAVVILSGATAQADTVVGEFSNPVLSGSVANLPNPGDVTAQDNTSSAVTSFSSIINPNDTLHWGSTPGQSTLQFVGLFPIPADPTTPFQIGTLFFANASSALDTIIFGATLNFYKDDGSSLTPLGSDNIIITTTSNQHSGSGLTVDQLNADADYINICGFASNMCGVSLQAYEFGENSVSGSIVVNLFATIVGDPQITVQSATLSDGSVGNGIVGNELPQGQVPEPGTLVLMSTGIALIGIIRRRAQRPV